MVLIRISMKNGVSGSLGLHWVRAVCLPWLRTLLAIVFTPQPLWFFINFMSQLSHLRGPCLASEKVPFSMIDDLLLFFDHYIYLFIYEPVLQCYLTGELQFSYL